KSRVAPGGDCATAVACVARAVNTNDPRLAKMACLVIVRRPPLRAARYEREVTATGYTPCERGATASFAEGVPDSRGARRPEGTVFRPFGDRAAYGTCDTARAHP